MKRTVNALLFIYLFTFSVLGFASNTISVEVFTEYKDAAAIGFKVQGKNHGGLGHSMKGSGPANETYEFGIRNKSIFGDDIGCGSIVLTEDSTVELTVSGQECTSKIVPKDNE